MIKTLVHRTSNWEYKEVKEFKDEKEMLEYGIKENSDGENIIISKHKEHDYDMEIYDDYRE